MLACYGWNDDDFAAGVTKYSVANYEGTASLKVKAPAVLPAISLPEIEMVPEQDVLLGSCSVSPGGVDVRCPVRAVRRFTAEWYRMVVLSILWVWPDVVLWYNTYYIILNIIQYFVLFYPEAACH